MNLEEAKNHKNKKLMTLGLAKKGDQILLAMKKRGFGVGWWNGYGGKVKEGETIEDGLKREIIEETETLNPIAMEQRGTVYFEFEGDDKILEMHVFDILEFEGEPSETEEMRPQWFSLSEIPYDSMWPGDDKWIPQYLEGGEIEGLICFTADKEFISADIRNLSLSTDDLVDFVEEPALI